MKTCPFCAEEIADAAVVCKHCGRELNPGAVQVIQEQTTKRVRGPRGWGCVWITLGGLVVLFLIGRVLFPTDRGATPDEGPFVVTVSGDYLSVENRTAQVLESCEVKLRSGHWAHEARLEPGHRATFYYSQFGREKMPISRSEFKEAILVVAVSCRTPDGQELTGKVVPTLQ